MNSIAPNGSDERLPISNQRIISVDDLNHVIGYFEKLGLRTRSKDKHPQTSIGESKKIYLIPENEFDRVNIVFVAGLILLQRTYECSIYFDYSKISAANNLHELFQYNAQGNTLYGVRNRIVYYSSQESVPSNDNTFSGSFAPIFFINP